MVVSHELQAFLMPRRKKTKRRRKKVKLGRLEWSRRVENRRFVLDYLLSHPCVDCGETDIIVLEFDHVDRRKKTGTIGELLHLTLARVKQELEKCQVRCCNCHRRRTATQLGWKRVEVQKKREMNQWPSSPSS